MLTTTTIHAFTSPSKIGNRPATIITTAATSSSIHHRYHGILHMVPSSASALASTSVSASTSTSSASSSSTSSLVLPKTQYPNPQLEDPWYSTKIQTDMGYTTKVKSLYLRHCVLERKETAELALQWYLQLTSSGSSISADDDCNNIIKDLKKSRDPFGDVTKQLSACSMTRDEGGNIGWVDIDIDVDVYHDADNSNNKKKKELTAASLIPDDILRTLVELQPKAGDVHIVGPSSITHQVHVIRVEELYIPNMILPESIIPSTVNNKTIKLGSFNGVNALVPRNKLKGHGVMPTVPNFELQKNRKGETIDNVVDNDNDDDPNNIPKLQQR
mmetsp:Transcript_20971/g.24030  ORF Transcript_20971/g.24030 Transcript_20971/m.24030 type:complete len:330 (+) Transcript_20971:218-1207(+)